MKKIQQLKIKKARNDSHKYFKDINNQRTFMDELFHKFELKTMEDWMKVSRKKIIKEGGKSLVVYYHSNNFTLLLSRLYPNYPWDFRHYSHRTIKNKTKDYFNKENNQHLFLSHLFVKWNFSSLDDWLTVSKEKLLKEKGGSSLLNRYSNDMQTLLSSLYPNFPWLFHRHFFLFNNPLSSSLYFKSKENQRRFMEEVYKEGELKDLSDWLLFTTPSHLLRFLSSPSFSPSSSSSSSRKKEMKSKMKRMYGEYENNHFLLLSSIYPHYPWPFIDWKNGENMKSIGDIESEENNQKKEKEEVKEEQREKLRQLFFQFQLSSLDDWLFIGRNLLIEKGGEDLIRYYRNDIQHMYRSLYPHYPWVFDHIEDLQLGHLSRCKTNKYFHAQSYYYNLFHNRNKLLFGNTDRQRVILEKIFHHLNLSSFSDWELVTKHLLLLSFPSFKYLIAYYANDFPYLLSSLYPQSFQSIYSIILSQPYQNNQWENDIQKIKEEKVYEKFKFTSPLWRSSLIDRLRRRMRSLIHLYSITQKNHFYRLPTHFSSSSLFFKSFSLIPLLQTIYPDHDWNPSLFHFRSKKSKQRLLFSSLLSIFPSQMIIEDYRHPLLLPSLLLSTSSEKKAKEALEVDLFMPGVNVAIEYQGEQHYDEIPSGFCPIDFYQSHDQLKHHLCKLQSIHLISVPYWSSFSPSSLVPFLSSSLSSYYLK